MSKRNTINFNNTPNFEINKTNKKEKIETIKLNRKYANSNFSSTAARAKADWEPGIDIDTTDVVLSSVGSLVTVVDYSPIRYKIEKIHVLSPIKSLDENQKIINTPFKPEILDELNIKNRHNRKYYNKLARKSIRKLDRKLGTQPNWSNVRWISVKGLSWETISHIADYYGLHRLALEDMIDIPQRAKVDSYKTHLYCCLPLIKLIKTVINKPSSSPISISASNTDSNSKSNKKPFSTLVIYKFLYENISSHSNINKLDDFLIGSNGGYKISGNKKRLIDSLKPLSYRNLAVGNEQVSLFLTDDNTVISFFEHSSNDIENAILSRLIPEYTILRESCDGSLLLEAIIDAVVDLTYPVLNAYRRRFSEFQFDILSNPNVSHTQNLHLMISELSILVSTLNPVTSLVHALKDLSKSTLGGYPICGLYLSDIADHTQSITEDIKIMRNNIENLIDLIFNTVSYESNDSMKLLTIVTVIFSPLSFWCGYYGMNFEVFPEIQQNSSFFWKIAVPFSVAIVVIGMWKSIYNYSRRNITVFKKAYSERKISRGHAKEEEMKEQMMRERKNRQRRTEGHLDDSRIKKTSFGHSFV
ncbi:uncharacterized protein ASCRUDRAFT_37539 [Ascoidea rubescens DSM 1968]|uniref:Cora-domain-containing protein n=1 Tax=Ascoidea rubescens DSM 1968 TaxID=1344418 RepID=A0A1D2VCD0_9ASCO|nr:hypothetical protein ASCRUDRAFT_37539 [Ascoidea rubescens DSM 1968]ODV59338.1 hypothetical protein ASCRUDRAFT_37539 [Ascoidea rubescens DSM 1968]